MTVITTAKELQEHIQSIQQKGQPTGFVPTMGALHQGHISLIEAANNLSACTICSIFVNPAQFNDPADYDKYPITTSQDIQLLETAGAHILFLPPVKEVYPAGFKELEQYDLGYLETLLEGRYRPGHFQGVCQVMRRLLQIVRPSDLFMGQKDYQQCMVVKKLMELAGMHDINFHVCATVREPDGLAMSSRNLRLSPEGRQRATVISAALSFIKNNIQPGNLAALKQEAIAMLQLKELKADYLEIADANTLEPVDHWDGNRRLVALAAAFVDDVRLIDNMVVN